MVLLLEKKTQDITKVYDNTIYTEQQNLCHFEQAFNKTFYKKHYKILKH